MVTEASEVKILIKIKEKLNKKIRALKKKFKQHCYIWYKTNSSRHITSEHLQ